MQLRFYYLFICVLPALFSCESSDPTPEKKKEKPLSAILTYMIRPGYAHEQFTEQVTGTSARLEYYDRKEKLLYFSIDSLGYEQSGNLTQLSLDTSKIVFARMEGQRQVLEDQIFDITDKYVFRIHLEDIYLDSTRSVFTHFGDIAYTASLTELRDFITNSSLYGGYVIIHTGEERNGKPVVIANHSAPVAKKGEPSLERLAATLVSEDQPMEVQVQQLLDFVSTQITYNGDGRSEILRRPNEVLLRRKSDCSGKVILFASLLEQIEVDYLLMYTDNHITVGVQGTFPTRNHMYVDRPEGRYFVAETTTPGFVIGITELIQPLYEDRFELVQEVGRNTKAYHLMLADSLEFM
ncbi:MAG: hypothetical protein AAF655_00955 [Bacteroidota bacterium]